MLLCSSVILTNSKDNEYIDKIANHYFSNSDSLLICVCVNMDV